MPRIIIEDVESMTDLYDALAAVTRTFRDQDAFDVEVALGGRGGTQPDRLVGQPGVCGTGVGVGVHGDGAQPQGAGGSDDAAGDLAAVGDEHGVEHGALPLVGG
jgi:hypothetical protein